MRKKAKQLNKAQNIILLIFLLILANFLFWSFVFGQSGGGSNLNIKAVVPVTPENSNINKSSTESTDSGQPIKKENKWLYYFQKSLEEQENPQEIETQTIYDKVASWGMMILLMVVVGAVLVVLLRFGEKIIRRVRGTA